MSDSIPREIYFLLDARGALIVFEEKRASWVGVLGFSSERAALDFIRTTRLDASDVAAIDAHDSASVAGLISLLKPRAVRNLILDLDYRTGDYLQVEFEGDRFGAPTSRKMEPAKTQ